MKLLIVTNNTLKFLFFFISKNAKTIPGPSKLAQRSSTNILHLCRELSQPWHNKFYMEFTMFAIRMYC